MKANFLKEEIQGLLLDFSKRQKIREERRLVWKEERRISRAKMDKPSKSAAYPLGAT